VGAPAASRLRLSEPQRTGCPDAPRKRCCGSAARTPGRPARLQRPGPSPRLGRTAPARVSPLSSPPSAQAKARLPLGQGPRRPPPGRRGEDRHQPRRAPSPRLPAGTQREGPGSRQTHSVPQWPGDCPVPPAAGRRPRHSPRRSPLLHRLQHAENQSAFSPGSGHACAHLRCTDEMPASQEAGRHLLRTTFTVPPRAVLGSP